MARLGAGVRKRPDGTLEKRFTVNGKRYSVYGKTSKELVQNEQEIRKKIEEGIYTENKNLTLDQYFTEWLVGKRNGTKGNTLKTYKSYYYKHISPQIGTRKIQKIERREVLMLQKEISKYLSVTTCNTLLTVLKTIFNDAIKDEIINKNPTNGVKPLKETGKKAAETYHRALTEQEQADFMQEMASDYYYEFVSLLLCTGIRIGEAAALAWSDIDYKQNVIHINKTVTFHEDGTITIGSPKSEAGKREIPLNDSIKSILSSQKKKQSKIVQMGNQVFTSLSGEIVSNTTVNRAIRNALKRLGKKENQWNTLRHTL